MNDQLVAQAAHVNRITAEIVAISEQATQIVAMSAIRIGGLLKQAKEMIAPGEWGTYVEQQVKFSHRTANNCMKLHTEWEKNPNSQAIANFSYTKAVRLLSLPENEREDFIENHDVGAMSTRELDAAIKAENEQLKKDLAAANKAAADANAAAERSQKKVEDLTKKNAKAAEDKEKAEAALQELQNNPAIPPEVMERIRKEISDTTIASARAEVQAQLDAAQKNLDAATAARKDAEKAVAMADPDVAAFNILLVQLQESYNKLNGYRLKIQTKNEDLYTRCTEAQKALLQVFERAVS